ncbi:MAG: rhomboid family intramembrane serine protease, partial [Cyclobacteriaceae bacterium]
VYGLFFYLLVFAFRNSKKELYVFILSCLVISVGFFAGLFPGREQISYEGHIFGSISGVLVALFDKKPRKKKPVVSNVSFSADADFQYYYKD